MIEGCTTIKNIAEKRYDTKMDSDTMLEWENSESSAISTRLDHSS